MTQFSHVTTIQIILQNINYFTLFYDMYHYDQVHMTDMMTVGMDTGHPSPHCYTTLLCVSN